MEIIEYEDKYEENVKDLLVELQEHLVAIDSWHFQVMKECYREGCFKRDMQAVKTQNGKIFLCKENNNVVGLVLGTIPPPDDEDKETNTCAKNGHVIELIVSKNCRGSGIGKALLKKMEDYFKSMGCENISIEVYAPNTSAYKFYEKNGYKPLDIFVMKKIKKEQN